MSQREAAATAPELVPSPLGLLCETARWRGRVTDPDVPSRNPLLADTPGEEDGLSGKVMTQQPPECENSLT